MCLERDDWTMWPWGHAAVAYLCYLVFVRATDRLRETPAALAAVLVGSQFPDLVDKPLAWSFAVLPSGRSLTHSLITAALVLSVLYWLAGGPERRNAVAAFGLGWITHSLSDLGADTVVGLLLGDTSQLRWTTYLVWPLLPPPPYESDDSLIAHLQAFELSGSVRLQIGLFGLAVVFWVVKSALGAYAARTWLERIVRIGGRRRSR